MCIRDSSIFCSQMNRSLSRVTEVKTEALASDIGDDQLFYEYWALSSLEQFSRASSREASATFISDSREIGRAHV